MSKKILSGFTVVLSAMLFLTSCGSSSEPNNSHEAAENLSGKDVDPVCDMVRDETWTDYSVSASGDTTWFCSEFCKDAYAAAPEKYPVR